MARQPGARGSVTAESGLLIAFIVVASLVGMTVLNHLVGAL